MALRSPYTICLQEVLINKQSDTTLKLMNFYSYVLNEKISKIGSQKDYC